MRSLVKKKNLNNNINDNKSQTANNRQESEYFGVKFWNKLKLKLKSRVILLAFSSLFLYALHLIH